MKSLGFVLVMSLVETAGAQLLVPSVVPTPTYEVNLAGIQIDKDGIDMQYRYISPSREVKGWDTIRVLRLAKESDKDLYRRATDVIVAAARARDAEFKAIPGTVSKPTPTASPTKAGAK